MPLSEAIGIPVETLRWWEGDRIERLIVVEQAVRDYREAMAEARSPSVPDVSEP